ncbi:MAG: hypothetical protein ACAH11_10420 [Sphingomonas sp.]
MKPNSIVQFERLFLAALAVRVLNDAVGVTASLNALKANPLTANYGVGAVIGVLAVIYGAALLLWYLVTRRQSGVAKWILSIWFVISTCTMALALFKGGFGLNLGTLSGWAMFLLFAWSVSYLFKPDADAWFAKAPPSAG